MTNPANAPVPDRAEAARRLSPALAAGLAVMPLLIGAGLLREWMDAPELRPTLSSAPAAPAPVARLALRAAP